MRRDYVFFFNTFNTSFFWHFFLFCSFINLDLTFVFVIFFFLLPFLLFFFHFIVSLYLSFFPCFYLSPSVDSLWPFLFFFFCIIFLFVSSYFFLRLGYRLYWSSKEEKQRRFFKKRCNIMVRECENFFQTDHLSFFETKGTRFAYVFEKYRLFHLSLYKNSSFPFFFFLNSVGCDALFLFLSFLSSLIYYIAQRLEKNQDRCNNFNGTQ